MIRLRSCVVHVLTVSRLHNPGTCSRGLCCWRLTIEGSRWINTCSNYDKPTRAFTFDLNLSLQLYGENVLSAPCLSEYLLEKPKSDWFGSLSLLYSEWLNIKHLLMYWLWYILLSLLSKLLYILWSAGLCVVGYIIHFIYLLKIKISLDYFRSLGLH